MTARCSAFRAGSRCLRRGDRVRIHRSVRASSELLHLL
jgi:hypothetical protein